MRLRHLTAAFLLASASAPQIYAQVLTFEDLTTRNNFSVLGIAGSYAGYHWGTSLFGTQSSPTGWASATVTQPAIFPANPPVSGSSYLWNWNGPQSVFIDFLAPTNVTGAWFSTLSSAYGRNALSVQLFGYNSSGLLVATSLPLLLTNSYQFASANFSSVNAIEVRANADGQWWSMDDLTLSSSSAVPEPASIALLGTGLVGLLVGGAVRRRRSPRVS